MNKITEVFGSTRVLLPVIHPVDWDQALANVGIAQATGVRGVFVIDQGMSADEVLALVNEIRKCFPTIWVGVNLLRCLPSEALGTALQTCGGRIDGLWSDNAGIDERWVAQPEAGEFVNARRSLAWSGLYFGGVAFKYQSPVEDLAKAATLAVDYMDVICTSGPGTGKPAELDKVKRIRAAIGTSADLALASGVNATNVREYLPYVNAFLVGTGIERAFGVLDAEKTMELQTIIASSAE
jgi:predicted TIM-barrel enzyme